MATSSFFKTITISDPEVAARFLEALENPVLIKAEPVVYDHEKAVELIKKALQKRAL